MKKTGKTIRYKEIEVAKNKMRYDGYLYFPEYNLMIDPPFGGQVDIHYLGEMKTEMEILSGAWPSVVPKNLSVECFNQNTWCLGEKLYSTILKHL